MKKTNRIIAVVFAVLFLLSSAIIPSFAVGQTRYSVLVLDVSGSMYGEPLDSVKAASKKFVDYVLSNPNGDKNYVAIVTFESSSSVVSDFTDSKRDLYTAIDSLVDLGTTNLAAGINSAADLLENTNSASIKNMFIMCDGYPNEGYPDGETAAYNAVAGLPQNWNIVSMYFSDGYTDPDAENVMKKIGRNGYYGPIDNVADVEMIFADVWSEEATTKSVNKIIIIIACPVDVSVELDGVVLDKNNPKTLFGTLEFEGPANDQTKIVTLSYRDDYNIKIVGTGSGTMDYKVTYYCNEEELYSLTYPTIDINPITTVTGKVNFDDKKINLEVDNNGDGKIDLLVPPDGNSGGIFRRIFNLFKNIILEFWEHIKRLANIHIDFFS